MHLRPAGPGNFILRGDWPESESLDQKKEITPPVLRKIDGKILAVTTVHPLANGSCTHWAQGRILVRKEWKAGDTVEISDRAPDENQPPVYTIYGHKRAEVPF